MENGRLRGRSPVRRPPRETGWLRASQEGRGASRPEGRQSPHWGWVTGAGWGHGGGPQASEGETRPQPSTQWGRWKAGCGSEKSPCRDLGEGGSPARKSVRKRRHLRGLRGGGRAGDEARPPRGRRQGRQREGDRQVRARGPVFPLLSYDASFTQKPSWSRENGRERLSLSPRVSSGTVPCPVAFSVLFNRRIHLKSAKGLFVQNSARHNGRRP